MRVREGTLPGVADGLYSEVVTAGLGQPLDLVGVAGAAVDCHKPGPPKNTNKKEGLEAMNLGVGRETRGRDNKAR